MDDFFLDIKYNETGTVRSVSFEDEDILHYGRKGMRWGVRNRSKSEERARAKKFGSKSKGDAKSKPEDKAPEKESKKSSRTSADSAQAARLKERPLETLSNSQISALTKRMQLEKSYNEVMNPPKKSKTDERFEKLATFNKRAETVTKTFKSVTGKDLSTVLVSAIATTAGTAVTKQALKTGGKKAGKNVISKSPAGKATARLASQLAGP